MTARDQLLIDELAGVKTCVYVYVYMYREMKKKCQFVAVCLVLGCVAAAAAMTLRNSATTGADDLRRWEDFKDDYDREYNTTREEKKRKRTFLENLRQIREHNVRYELGLVNWRARVNRFSDWTRREKLLHVFGGVGKRRPRKA